jgi:hypothetical protein
MSQPYQSLLKCRVPGSKIVIPPLPANPKPSYQVAKKDLALKIEPTGAFRNTL